MEAFLAEVSELAQDAVLASSEAEAAALWCIRGNISGSLKQHGATLRLLRPESRHPEAAA
jgi:hypothetical protein